MIVVGIGLVVIILIALVVLGQRKRLREIARVLSDMGLATTFGGAESVKALAYEPFLALSEILQTGSKGLKWSAYGKRNGLRLHVIEHSYSKGSGKSRTTRTHTVVATPCPRGWANVAVTREHLFTRMGKLLGLKDLDLENPRFNKLWRVTCEDEGFALALLGMGVQEYLANTHKPDLGEQWRVVGGMLCVLRNTTMSAAKLKLLVERFEGFVGAMEPELREMLPKGGA